MRQPTNIALFQYWNELRDGRPAPYRTDIDPARIAQLLDRVFLIEVDADGRILFRLAGSSLAGQFGCELRGLELLRFFPVRERAQVSSLFNELVRTREVAVLDLTAANRLGETIELEMVLLPLARPTGVDRFIGAIVPHKHVDWAAFGPIIVCHQTGRKVFVPEGKVRTVVPRIGAAPRAIAHPVASEHPVVAHPAVRTAGRPATVGSGRRIFRVFDGGLAHLPRDAQRPEKR